MAQTKKRPSKTAKLAQKILADSKLIADHKANADAKNDQAFRENESSLKASTTANKIRPNKKRG